MRRGKRALACFTAVFLAACTPPPIEDQGYELVFQDEFNATAVDPLWATAPFGGSLPATVANGVLKITTTAANGYQWGYLAGTGARSTGEPNYPRAKAWREGYFEARIRFTDNPWSWPAFWLFSMAKTEAWPGENCAHLNAEWDVMENGIPNSDGTRPASSWYFTALHRNTSDGTADGYCTTPDTQRIASQDFTGTDLSAWHTWSGLWTADELCTYLDGVEIQCMDPYDSTRQPMHLTFTMQYLQTCGGCPSRPASLEMQVDWVRVWQER
jgi:beta-glucanase (GH16 family)